MHLGVPPCLMRWPHLSLAPIVVVVSSLAGDKDYYYGRLAMSKVWQCARFCDNVLSAWRLERPTLMVHRDVIYLPVLYYI